MVKMRASSFLVLVLLTTAAFLPLISASEMEYEINEIEMLEDTKDQDIDGLTNGIFTENQGQWSDDLRFVASTSFGHIGICGDRSLMHVSPEGDSNSYILEYRWLNSNNVVPIGLEELPHSSSYFTGSDPSRWVSGASNYGSVIYSGLWDRIDLLYHFSQDGIKYEFIMGPGADPSDIRVEVRGHEEMIVSDDRIDVVLPEDGPKLSDDDLYVFHSDDGSRIDARFTGISNDVFGFELGNYDNSREVRIDPLVYSSYVGGGSSDYAYGLDLDSSGNGYVTGTTGSSNFPTTPGAYNTSAGQNDDIFVFKMNSSGTSLLYSTYIGGSSSDYGTDIVIDQNGNAYVTGYTDEIWTGGNQTNTTTSDFPVTSGAYDTSHNGGLDTFVLKLDSSGSSLLYSTLLGSNSSEYGYGIDVDNSGNAFAVGYTYSRNFPTTSGAYITTFSGGVECYVVKLNSTGGKLLFSTFLGGTSREEAYDIKIDSSGNSYITGCTYSSDFPTTTGAYDTSHNSQKDVFLTKLNSTGAGLVYSTYVGGGSDDCGFDVEIDSSGNAYVVGSTYYYYTGGNSTSGGFPTTFGAYDRSHNGQWDIFTFKINSGGSSLVYSTFIGGGSSEEGYGLSLDSSGTAYITGYSNSYDFPTTWGAYDTSRNGGSDAIVVKMNVNGTGLDYSTFIGGSSTDSGRDIEHPGTAHAVITGYTRSSNLPTVNTSYDRTNNGNYDAFLTKLDFIRSAPPTAPRNLQGTLRSNDVLLTWDYPADNGTATLLGFKIYRYTSGGNGSGNRSAWWTYIATVGPVTSWSDFSITLGNDYYYYLRAYNSVGDSPESNYINVSDILRPNFLEDYTPETTYSGESLTLTIGVMDNVKVKKVEAFYWYPGKLVRNGMMGKVGGQNWSLSIDIHLDMTDKLLYYFRAEDYYKNTADLNTREVDILNGRPSFVTDMAAGEGSTGEEFEFSVEVVDNTNVFEVTVDYWYGGGATNNISMIRSGDVWSLDITIEDTLISLKYRYHAVDGSGHWNQTDIKTVVVKDNDLPSLVQDDAPSIATTGDPFMFMVDVEDNIEVTKVSVEYWFGEGAPDNVTLDKWSEDIWRIAVNIPENDLSTLHYRYWISDASGNTVTGPEVNVEVRDNILPSVLSDGTSGKAYTGSGFKFQVQVTDNIDVEEVWIEYWFEGGAVSNTSAVEGSDLYWELDIEIPHMLDDLLFKYHIKDSSGNWFESIEGTADVEDDLKPVFMEDSTPDTISTGDTLMFEVRVADNIRTGLVVLEYWFGYGDHMNVSMVGSIDYTFSVPISVDETDDIHYYFSAADTSSNWNRTKAKTVSLEDDDLPEITGDSTPSSADGGTKLTFTVYAEDNIGMSEVKVEYWFDDGEHTNSTMMGTEPFRFVIDLPDEGGTLHYRIHASDMTGNLISSEIKDIDVVPKGGVIPPDDDDDDDDITPPDDDDDDDVAPAEEDNIPIWVWIMIIVVIVFFILTVANIYAAAMRRKYSKPTHEEIPDEQAAMIQPQQEYPPYQQQAVGTGYEQQVADQYPVPPPEGMYYQGTDTQGYPSPPVETAPISYDQGPQEVPIMDQPEVQPSMMEQDVSMMEQQAPSMMEQPDSPPPPIEEGPLVEPETEEVPEETSPDLNAEQVNDPPQEPIGSETAETTPDQ